MMDNFNDILSKLFQAGKKEETSFSLANTRGAIFILHKLPFDLPNPKLQHPSVRFNTANLARTYFTPLHQILMSILNSFGLVRAIFVNFGPMGYYELNPSKLSLLGFHEAQFEVLLRDQLFAREIISNSYFINEWMWRKIPNLLSIISGLPTNSRKIGCLVGYASDMYRHYQRYIANAPDEQTYVFVLGEIETEDIAAHIDDYVHVSQQNLNGPTQLMHVIAAMETKWANYLPNSKWA